MGEIVHLQVGSCGNNIGCKFWEVSMPFSGLLCAVVGLSIWCHPVSLTIDHLRSSHPTLQSISKEHGIRDYGVYEGSNDNQLKQVNAYFNEGSNGWYIPRAILTDLKHSTEDSVRAGSIGNLFRSDSFVFGNSADGAGSNYAKGYYTEGPVILDRILDAVRYEAEACDNLQGFQLMHSLGGGTGSGMGSLLISKIKEEYPDRIMTTYSVVPSQKVSDTIFEPYNAVLAMNHLINEADQCFVLDNEAMYDMCFRRLMISTPNYNNLNMLITAAITGATCSIRFPSEIVNGDLQSIASMNMIPFPRLHFFLMGYAPIDSPRSAYYPRQLTVPDLTREMFNANNILCAADPRYGKYFACTMMFRGSMSSNEVDTAVHIVSNQNSEGFVKWDPNKIKASICDIPPACSTSSSTLIANSTCIKNVWDRIMFQFSEMSLRKAYFHRYVSEGMDAMDFQEAEYNLKDLISEYRNYEEMNAEEDVPPEADVPPEEDVSPLGDWVLVPRGGGFTDTTGFPTKIGRKRLLGVYY